MAIFFEDDNCNFKIAHELWEALGDKKSNLVAHKRFETLLKNINVLKLLPIDDSKVIVDKVQDWISVCVKHYYNRPAAFFSVSDLVYW